MALPQADFIAVDGTRLCSLSGAPFVILGCNCHYLASWATDVGSRAAVDAVLDGVAALGCNTLRCWAFNDVARCDGGDDTPAWGALQTGPGVVSETGLCGLDYLIAGASRRGLRLILVLTNYWPEYGGMQAYLRWSDPSCPCDGDLTEAQRAAFYTHHGCRAAYLAYVATLADRVNALTGLRYSDDATILAWELVNEPRDCSALPATPTRLHAWLAAVAPAVKALVPRQLVTVGLEGFWAAAAPDVEPGAQQDDPVSRTWVPFTHGCDWASDCSVPGLDFACIHAYPGSWLPSDAACDDDACCAFVAQWLAEHVECATTQLRMPVVLTEVGFSSQRPGRLQLYSTVFGHVEACLAQPAPSALAGTCFWMAAHCGYPDGEGMNVAVAGDVSEQDAQLVRRITAHYDAVRAWCRRAALHA